MPNRLLGDEDGEQLGFAHRHAGKMRDRTGIIVAVALLIVLDGQQQAVAHEFDVPEDGLPGPQPEMFPHLAAIGVGAAPDLVVDIHHPGIRRPGMKVFLLFVVGHRCPFQVTLNCCQWSAICQSHRWQSAALLQAALIPR